VNDKGLIELGKKLLDRNWRLSNLYYLVGKDARKTLFKPNWAQLKLFDSLSYRNLDLKARQLGVTTGYCILWLDSILFNKDLRVGIVAHTKDDARIIFRDKIKYAYDALPEEIKAAIPCEKMDAHELLLKNGSGIRVGVTFRSGTVQILHVTEYGYICQKMPQRAEEIKTGAFQAVPKDGIIVVESTAKGRNGHFYELAMEAQKRTPNNALDWRFTFMPWWEDPEYTLAGESFAESQSETNYLDDLNKKCNITLTQGQREWYIRKWRELGDDIYAEYPSVPEEAFKQSTEGAYYGRLMLDAWHSGRITSVPIDPALPVETWWDIGRDTTSIWFVQRDGLVNRCVHYYQNAGEGLPHYAAYLDDFRQKKMIRYSRAIGPHDLRVTEWGGDVKRIDVASKLGINFEIAPEVSIADGIEVVRRNLPFFVFDEENCADGIKGLESYRKEWNPALGTWKDVPLHDFASHPADAFRYGNLAMAATPMIADKSRSAARPIKTVRWR